MVCAFSKNKRVVGSLLFLANPLLLGLRFVAKSRVGLAFLAKNKTRVEIVGEYGPNRLFNTVCDSRLDNMCDGVLWCLLEMPCSSARQ